MYNYGTTIKLVTSSEYYLYENPIRTNAAAILFILYYCSDEGPA